MKKITSDKVYSILKNFVEDEVHGGDFDQGNSLNDTLNILKKWWNKNKAKFFKDEES